MKIQLFLNRLRSEPQSIEFPDVIALINDIYDYVPTGFRNHELVSDVGQNVGSCKLFAFGRLHDLTESETLSCFGAYYRADVLRNEEGDSHPNIRQFMKTGWEGVEFFGVPLRAKPDAER